MVGNQRGPELKKISIDELRVGMYIHRLQHSWFNVPFYRRYVSSPRQIEKLREYGVRDIEVDLGKSEMSEEAAPEEVLAPNEAEKELFEKYSGLPESPRGERPAEPLDPIKEFHRLNRDVREAEQIVQKVQENITLTMRDAGMGRRVSVDVTGELVEEMIESVLNNDRALLALSLVENYHNYTYQHSINVAILMLTFGKYFNWDRAELRVAGLGALLHDVGKVYVPEVILNKPGGLTEAEFKIIRKHPLWSEEILRAVPRMPPRSLEVASQHHERYNGNGYPRGLPGYRLTKLGSVASLLDVFDALCADRPYRPAMTPNETLLFIYKEFKGQFIPGLFDQFVKCIGVYPVSSLVELDTGEVGVVVSLNREDQLHPSVILIQNAEGRKLPKPVIVDLRRRDPSTQKYIRNVSKALRPAERHLDVKEVITNGGDE